MTQFFDIKYLIKSSVSYRKSTAGTGSAMRRSVQFIARQADMNINLLPEMCDSLPDAAVPDVLWRVTSDLVLELQEGFAR